jgi:hypothetical protein
MRILRLDALHFGDARRACRRGGACPSCRKLSGVERQVDSSSEAPSPTLANPILVECKRFSPRYRLGMASTGKMTVSHDAPIVEQAREQLGKPTAGFADGAIVERAVNAYLLRRMGRGDSGSSSSPESSSVLISSRGSPPDRVFRLGSMTESRSSPAHS